MAGKIRRPRAEVTPLMDVLQAQLGLQPLPWMIGGSWRRGAPLIGDIDVMIITPDGTFADFRAPGCFTSFRGGEKIMHGHVRTADDEIRCDMWACTREQAGAFAMFITGPAALNITQRAHARTRGLTLSQYGLFSADGVMIPAFTEREVCAALGLAWLEPGEREPAVITVTDGEWTIPSSSRTLPYIARLRDGIWSCTSVTGPCPAWRFRRSCRHVDRGRELAARAAGASGEA